MKALQKTKSFILDILFPISCLSCGTTGVWLCESCLSKMQAFSFQVCPRCEKIIIESGKICQDCKRKNREKADFFLDGLIAAAKYRENGLSKIIHNYKYNMIRDLHIPLGSMLVKAFLDNGLPLPDAIAPIPLHQRRLRWRGFNQSELLANYVSQNLTPGMAIPVLKDILIRKKYTAPQMKVKKYAERRKNIQDAFALNPPLPPGERVARLDSLSLIDARRGVRGELKNKKILLIDDIATTGATLNECARILKLSGAKKVFALVLARQEFKKAVLSSPPLP